MDSRISCRTVSSKNGSDGSDVSADWAADSTADQSSRHSRLATATRTREAARFLQDELEPQDLTPESGAVRHRASLGIVNLLPDRIHLHLHETVHVPVQPEGGHFVRHWVNGDRAGVPERNIVARHTAVSNPFVTARGFDRAKPVPGLHRTVLALPGENGGAGDVEASRPRLGQILRAEALVVAIVTHPGVLGSRRKRPPYPVEVGFEARPAPRDEDRLVEIELRHHGPAPQAVGENRFVRDTGAA